MSEEGYGVEDPRVALETGGVSPLENLGADRCRNEEAAGWAGSWIWLRFLCLLDEWLDLP